MIDEDFIRRILDKTDNHDRRIGSLENSYAQMQSKIEFIIKELTDGRHAQQRTCDTLIKTGDELRGMLGEMMSVQHTMQLESAILKTSIESDRDYRKEKKIDNKWLTNVLMALPSVLISFAAIFAAISYSGAK